MMDLTSQNLMEERIETVNEHIKNMMKKIEDEFLQSSKFDQFMISKDIDIKKTYLTQADYNIGLKDLTNKIDEFEINNNKAMLSI